MAHTAPPRTQARCGAGRCQRGRRLIPAACGLRAPLGPASRPRLPARPSLRLPSPGRGAVRKKAGGEQRGRCPPRVSAPCARAAQAGTTHWEAHSALQGLISLHKGSLNPQRTWAQPLSPSRAQDTAQGRPGCPWDTGHRPGQVLH